LLCVSH